MELETDQAMTVADWAKVRLPLAKRVEALLWPVLAYDVLVPIDEPSNLNIVQRAVLDLAFCGLRDPVVIADHLQLDPDLMVIVLTELEGRNLLDDQRVPTDAARHRAEQAAARLAVRMVFQDPFTGQLWPLAAEKVTVAPIEWKDDRRRLAVGGKTWPVASVETGDRSQPSPPTARDILAAVRARPRHPEDGEAGGEPLLDEAERVSRVEVVSEQPASWLMPVVFYLPNPPDDVDGIVAIGIDGWPSSLLGHFMEVAARTDMVADRVRRRLDQAALDAHIGPHREYLARARADAEFDIERLVDAGWRKDPILWGELVDLQAQILEADSDPERCGKLLGNALIGAGRLFEQLSDVLYDRQPPPKVIVAQLHANGLLRKREEMVEVVQPAVKEARKTWAKDLLPEAVFGSKRGEELKPTGLSWHLARLVMAAHHNERHALRSILDEEPRWLKDVAKTASLRNPAAHAGGQIEASVALEGAKRAFELAQTAIRHVPPPGGSHAP